MVATLKRGPWEGGAAWGGILGREALWTKDCQLGMGQDVSYPLDITGVSKSLSGETKMVILN